MLRSFRLNGRGLAAQDPADLATAVWIDLLSPTAAEAAEAAQALQIDLPTREEMDEIELSARLYHEDGVPFMTALLPSNADSASPTFGPVTFVLAGSRLLTLRYHDPRPFRTFPAKAQNGSVACISADTVLLGLLEAIGERLADVLEQAGMALERLSREVFDAGSDKRPRDKDFRRILREIGAAGDAVSKLRDSLLTMERLCGFLTTVLAQRAVKKDAQAAMKTLMRDLRALSEHAGFVAQKVTFLLDATLGMINIEQNGIIKIFSVAAVVFLPPTLIASIYGMNFAFMPELGWHFGYPMAIGVMVASAILPFVWFKWKGWL
ncbi:MAG: magnesium transporter [Alphaproteobacteria bacterium HGW-Alphaproteobacteria-6]|nr:MAG: magnesium transporter [Alphaproteobacteria bacterium HGW-Alphaproteobacteria-6]